MGRAGLRNLGGGLEKKLIFFFFFFWAGDPSMHIYGFPNMVINLYNVACVCGYK